MFVFEEVLNWGESKIFEQFETAIQLNMRENQILHNKKRLVLKKRFKVKA